jgi:hypothetical protein
MKVGIFIIIAIASAALLGLGCTRQSDITSHTLQDKIATMVEENAKLDVSLKTKTEECLLLVDKCSTYESTISSLSNRNIDLAAALNLYTNSEARAITVTRQLLEDGNYDSVLESCDKFLSIYPSSSYRDEFYEMRHKAVLARQFETYIRLASGNLSTNDAERLHRKELDIYEYRALLLCESWQSVMNILGNPSTWPASRYGGVFAQYDYFGYNSQSYTRDIMIYFDNNKNCVTNVVYITRKSKANPRVDSEDEMLYSLFEKSEQYKQHIKCK